MRCADGELSRAVSRSGLRGRKDMPRKRPKFDVKKEIRKIARERVGTVPAAKVIKPKVERKKPKYKTDWETL